MTVTPTSRPTNCGRWVGRVPAVDGHLVLRGERAGEGEHEHDRDEPAEQHRDAERGVEPRRVRRESGEGGAVVVRRRREGVEHLADRPCTPGFQIDTVSTSSRTPGIAKLRAVPASTSVGVTRM